MFSKKVIDTSERIYQKYYDNLSDVLNNNEAHEFSLKCSIFCIDEILNSKPCKTSNILTVKGRMNFLKLNTKFWRKVKKYLINKEMTNRV